MEYYSAIKHKARIHTTTWMNFTDIMLKNTSSVIPAKLICSDRNQDSYLWVGHIDCQGTREDLLWVLTVFYVLIWVVVIYML